MSAPKTNVTKVQVPGEEQPKPDLDKPAEGAVKQPEDSPQPPADDAAPNQSAPYPTDAIDIEAMRAQIRAEERASIHAEMNHEMRAASKAMGKVGGNISTLSHRSKADYANMRAADIDHTTLVAPVMTKDGYLCPPPPEAKK